MLNKKKNRSRNVKVRQSCCALMGVESVESVWLLSVFDCRDFIKGTQIDTSTWRTSRLISTQKHPWNRMQEWSRSSSIICLPCASLIKQETEQSICNFNSPFSSIQKLFYEWRTLLFNEWRPVLLIKWCKQKHFTVNINFSW